MSRGMHLGHVAVKSVSSPISAAFDGKYVWVTNSGATKVFEVWANSTTNLGIDPVRKVTEVAQITAFSPDFVSDTGVPDEKPWVQDCGFITYGDGFMYITLKKQWSEMEPPVEGRSKLLFDCILKVNVLSRKIVEVIRTPISQQHKDEEAPWGHETPQGEGNLWWDIRHQYVMMNSVLHYCDGKLWMVDDYVDGLANGSQRVWCYNTVTGLWSFSAFAGKLQKNRAQITSANGNIYISAYNSLSVLKYDAATGLLLSSIRGNANPNALAAQPDGRILVASYKGLISHLNTDDSWTHDLQCETDECTCLAYENDSYCWAIDGESELFKVRADNYVNGTKYDGQDYKILVTNDLAVDEDLPTRVDITTSPLWDFDKLALQGDMIDLQYNSLNGYGFSSTIDFAMIIRPIEYQKWNGSSMTDVDQSALLVLLTDSEIVVINTSEIKFGFPRPAIIRSTMSAVGVGMISFGPNDYTGD